MTENFTKLIREHRWIVLMSLAFLLLGALRLNDLSLYTDSTRYVIWGSSFAQGKGLVDQTQPDPEYYVVNAPLYAVLVSPPLLVFPNSLLAAKVWTMLWGVAFILLFYCLLRRFFGQTSSVLASLLLVFNPLLLLLSTEVLSEAAFLTFVTVTFLMLERLESAEKGRTGDFLILLLATSFIVLLREVAVALLGAVVLYLITRRQYRRAALVLTGFAVVTGLWMVRNLIIVGAPATSQATNVNFVFEHFLTPPQAPLAQELGLRFLSNVSGYSIHLGGLILSPVPEALIAGPGSVFLLYYKAMSVAKYIIPVLFLPLLIVGIWRDLAERSSGTARALFVFGFLLIIFVYPVFDVRFLLPVVPFMIFYVVAGVDWIGKRWSGTRIVNAHLIAGTCAVLLTSGNLISIYEMDRTNIRYNSDPPAFNDYLHEAGLAKNLFTKPWRILGDTIQTHTPGGSILAGAMKDIVLFIGDRKLLELNNGVPVTTFNSFLRAYGAEYLIATQSWDNFQAYEFQMAESQRFWFEPVAQAAGMKLFRIHPTHTTPKDSWLTTKRLAIDTITANGLLRKGRIELLRGQFDQAIPLLLRAKQLAPNQALVSYQLCVAYSMSGMLSEASAELQHLYTYGQSTTYIPLATKHLAIAHDQFQVEQVDNPVQRSIAMTEFASSYWNLGYHAIAYSMLRSQLATDSTYFTGLLWGWHYAVQRGDIAQARIYLRQLRGIDGSNPLVQRFTTVELIGDSLRKATDPLIRSRHHLAIAELYKAVDLPEEAIDEAQRSLRENPRNAEAALFQARLFSNKHLPFAARRAYRETLAIDPNNGEAKLNSGSADR